jgi:hypothetical protein
MVRRTDPKEDDWQHVTDAKKRKQIQDRLAQRARRKHQHTVKASNKSTQLTTTRPTSPCRKSSFTTPLPHLKTLHVPSLKTHTPPPHPPPHPHLLTLRPHRPTIQRHVRPRPRHRHHQHPGSRLLSPHSRPLGPHPPRLYI